MSNRHLPAKSQYDRVVFDPQLPTPLMSRGLDYLAAKKIAVNGPSMDPVLLWSYEATSGDGCLCEVTIADGIAVVAATESTFALDAVAGAELWRLETRCGRTDLAYAQLRDGMVFQHIHIPDGVISAIGARTGLERWRRLCHHASFFLDDLLYVLTEGISDAETELTALDPTTGEELGSFRPELWWEDMPVAKHGMVYTLDGGFLKALDRMTRQERWRVFLSRNDTDWGSSTIKFVGDSLVVQHFLRDKGEQLLVFNPVTGEERWRRSTFDGYFEPVENWVFVRDSEGMVLALDMETGTERWRYATGERYGNLSPCVSESHVYVEGMEGTLTLLDVTTGLPQWSVEVPGSRWTRNISTHLGVVYLSSHLSGWWTQSYDEILLQALDTRTGGTLWSIELLVKPVWKGAEKLAPVRSITATRDGVFVLTKSTLQVLHPSVLPPNDVPLQPPTRWTLLDSETARLLGRDSGLFQQTGTP